MALTLNGSTGLSGIIGSAGTPALQGTDTNTGYFFGTDILGLSTAGTERLRITAAGNLALGNDGSFPIFDNTNDRTIFIGTGSDDAGIQLHSATDRFGGIYFGDATSGTDRYSGYIEYKHNDNYLRFATGSTEKVRITSDGKIGIGTTSPTTHLHVNSGATNTAALFESTDTETTIQLKDTTGSSYIKARNDFRFENSTGELVRIDSGGDVLIGLTSTPSGNGTNLWVSDGTVARLGVEKTGTGACKTTIGAGSDRAFNIYNETADHEIIRGETDGDVKITTGNLIIGTNGKGIDFSATSDTAGKTTEILDDYEEGTWTPALTNDGTMSTANGTYTKVGRLVHVKFSFTVNQINSANTNHVTGLPYSAAEQGYGQHGYFASLGSGATNAFNSISPYATGGTIYWNIITTANAFSQNPVMLGNSARCDGTITYTTN